MFVNLASASGAGVSSLGWSCRDYSEYEETKRGKIREANGSGDAITKLLKMITDGRPPRVAVPVLRHVPDRRRSTASAHHHSHHQLHSHTHMCVCINYIYK